MPLIRERVPQQLGIAGDCSIDPMTAVALGAAIFAESRDWAATATTRKPSRASATTGGSLDVTFDYQARTTADQAILRARVKSRAVGYEVQVDSHEGWTSGRKALADGFEAKLPLRGVGEHHFHANVFDPAGRPVPSASTDLVIVRAHASARAMPATHNIAVKVRESEFNERNTLDILLEKGAKLPTEGVRRVRAARTLKPDEAEHIDIELFQQDRPQAPQPELNLLIGAFRIEGKDLTDGHTLRKGDEIEFHWQMDESGVLTASVGLPTLRLHLAERRFYVPQAGHQSFEGEDGTRLAATALDEAEHDLERAETIVGNGAAGGLEALRRQLARQREELERAFDADANRSLTEEARRLRQDVAILINLPEHRGAALGCELSELKSGFNYRGREIADPRQIKRFDELADSAAREIERGGPGLDTAQRQLDEMRSMMRRVLWSDPPFLAEIFNAVAEESYLAIDPELHARQVGAGRKALLRGDIEGLRDILFELIGNRMTLGTGGEAATVLATIVRA
jgi:molecular chaperone DnaK